MNCVYAKSPSASLDPNPETPLSFSASENPKKENVSIREGRKCRYISYSVVCGIKGSNDRDGEGWR